MNKVRKYGGTLAVAIVLMIAAVACARKLPNQPNETDHALLLQKQQDGIARNEAIKDRLDPFVEVRNGRFVMLPGAANVVQPAIVDAVEKHLAELNVQAEKGELTIQADRQVVTVGAHVPNQTLACWRGVQTNWWGWYIGMTDSDIHAILDGFNSIDRMKSALSRIGVTLPWQINLYYNVLKYNLKVFDGYICKHSCETVTIYYWAIPTPFLNCQ